MGRTSREKPERLAEKLLQIRLALDLSQGDLLNRFGLSERLNRDDVSKYERGVREPSLLTLLAYSRVAGIHMEVLADDDVDLPEKLSAKSRRKG